MLSALIHKCIQERIECDSKTRHPCTALVIIFVLELQIAGASKTLKYGPWFNPRCKDPINCAYMVLSVADGRRHKSDIRSRQRTVTQMESEASSFVVAMVTAETRTKASAAAVSELMMRLCVFAACPRDYRKRWRKREERI